ncbi:enamine deaminase RidA (YjgF/YER057c/UK114 family) [Streptomyces glaucescens]
MERSTVNPWTWSVEMGYSQGEIISGHLVRLNVYTTDVDRLFEHYGVLAARLGAAGVAPATSMLGVTRLALPDLMVELEGTAVA